MFAVLFKSLGGIGASAGDSSPGGRSAEGAGLPAFADVSSFASSKVLFTSSQNFLVSTSFTGVDSVPLMAYYQRRLRARARLKRFKWLGKQEPGWPVWSKLSYLERVGRTQMDRVH